MEQDMGEDMNTGTGQCTDWDRNQGAHYDKGQDMDYDELGCGLRYGVGYGLGYTLDYG